MTNSNQIEQETKDARIVASKQLWQRFAEWMKLRGHQTLPEGLRAAIAEVTKFNPEGGND